MVECWENIDSREMTVPYVEECHAVHSQRLHDMEPNGALHQGAVYGLARYVRLNLLPPRNYATPERHVLET
jgi:hypothetical protein